MQPDFAPDSPRLEGEPSETKPPVLGPARPVATPEEAQPWHGADQYRPSLLWAVLLFILTGLSLWLVQGPVYAATLLLILLCHEMGHFVQARRYGVRTSYPLFIPMPFTILGTMGAMILMRSNVPNRKALFDIGITGPLAGLVPAIVASAIGIYQSEVVATDSLPPGNYLEAGEPLLFTALQWLIKGPQPEGHTLLLNSVGFAGWVGLFITALNLLPFSQLDGGHILYAMLHRRAHLVSLVLIVVGIIGAIGLAVVYGSFVWIVILLLVTFIGPFHPPTQNDAEDIGSGRRVLGWLTLSFIVVGFTPNPISLRTLP